MGLGLRGAVRLMVGEADVLRVRGRVAEAVEVVVGLRVAGGARVPEDVEDGVRECAEVPVADRVAVTDWLAVVVAD